MMTLSSWMCSALLLQRQHSAGNVSRAAFQHSSTEATESILASVLGLPNMLCEGNDMTFNWILALMCSGIVFVLVLLFSICYFLCLTLF